MNPPEVDIATMPELIEIILEYIDVLEEMFSSAIRELTEEELEVLESFGEWLEQWREDIEGYFTEYE